MRTGPVFGKLEAPSRMKLFLWRICRDVIPTRMRLKDKGIDCPSTCAHSEDGLKNL